MFIGRIDVEAESPNLWPPDARTNSFEKTLVLGKIESRRGKATTEDEVGWHHRLDGHELEQAPGVGDGQGSLACCSPWGCNGSDVERLN